MLNRNRLSGQQRQHQQQQQQQLEIHRKQAKAERVRKLWVDFEQWLKHPRNEMERERDQLLHQTGRVTSAAVKASRRRIEGAYFHKAREEWQRRLRAVELRESDWDPMQEAEMKAVEEALGVDDAEGYITDPSPSPPHQIIPTPSSLVDSKKSIATLGSFVPPPVTVPAPAPPPPSVVAAAAPPLAASSSTSSTSSYECVRPEDFHSEDDEELTPDSDYSSFSSTISTIISEEDEVVGPVTEYMFTQALESSGFTGVPLDSLNDKVPVISRANVPAPPKLTENGSRGGPPLAPPPKRPPDVNVKPSPPQPPQPPPVSKTNSAASNNSPSPQSLPPSTSASKKSQASSSSSKPSRIHYPLVAPSLSDLSDYDEVGDDAETGSKRLSPSLVAQFEAQFEAMKLQIRIDKIREFHQLACESDAELCVNLAQGRRNKTLTRQEESRLVEEHYQRTVALRERLEKERKEQVKQEQRRMRDELSRRNTTSNTSIFGSGHHGGPRQGRFPVVSQESDTDPEDEMKQKLEKMKQEQMALQAKYASAEVTKAPLPTTTMMGRKRASTLTADNAPAVRGLSAVAGINDKRFEESDHGSTPRPSGSAWSSIKPPPSSSNGRNILNNQNQNAPSKKGTSPFDFSLSNDPAFGVSSSDSYVDVDSVDREADNEDEDEQEKENAGFWSYLTSGQKKKAPQPSLPSAPSPWNFAGTQPRNSQKPVNGKSRLGIVTSAWDDGEEEKDPVVADNPDAVVGKELEKEVESLEKTPVIPSAPAPNVSNKKQSKKQQRLAGKKATGSAPAPAPPAANKAESSNPQPQQKGGQAKSAPVSVPTKGRKSSLVDGDDLSSTPRPSVLKRLQAQLANEEAEHDDDSPTTPRPAVASTKKSVPANNSNNPWARGFGKGASSALSNSGFDDAEDDDDDAADLIDPRPNGKKNGDAPQVPGSWKWGDNKSRSQVDLPPPVAASTAAITTASTRKGAAGRQSEPETTKKKGKKAVNGQRSAWGVKRTTVEEVPDDEGDDLISGSMSESLPYNSRSILEARDAVEVVEQPRILEPKPSKPRTMYENIFQYDEVAAAADAEDLRDGLDWSEERLASALARMAQESAEMDRRVNSLGAPAVPASGVNGTNGVANAAAAASASISMSKPVVVAEQNMNVPGPKKVRWQQPSTINGLDSAAPSQQSQAFVNKMVSRSYDDEAFSPMGAAAFPALHFGSYGGQTNGLASGGWPPANGHGQYGNPFAADAEPEDDELARTARSLFETIHISASSQQRNRPGFAAA